MTSEVGSRTQCNSIGPQQEPNRNQHRTSRGQPPQGSGVHPIRNRFATEKIKNNEPESFSSMQKRKSQNGNGNENVPKQCRATKAPTETSP